MIMSAVVHSSSGKDVDHQDVSDKSNTKGDIFFFPLPPAQIPSFGPYCDDMKPPRVVSDIDTGKSGSIRTSSSGIMRVPSKMHGEEPPAEVESENNNANGLHFFLELLHTSKTQAETVGRVDRSVEGQTRSAREARSKRVDAKKTSACSISPRYLEPYRRKRHSFMDPAFFSMLRRLKRNRKNPLHSLSYAYRLNAVAFVRPEKYFLVRKKYLQATEKTRRVLEKHNTEEHERRRGVFEDNDSFYYCPNEDEKYVAGGDRNECECSNRLLWSSQSCGDVSEHGAKRDWGTVHTLECYGSPAGSGGSHCERRPASATVSSASMTSNLTAPASSIPFGQRRPTSATLDPAKRVAKDKHRPASALASTRNRAAATHFHAVARLTQAESANELIISRGRTSSIGESRRPDTPITCLSTVYTKGWEALQRRAAATPTLARAKLFIRQEQQRRSTVAGESQWDLAVSRPLFLSSVGGSPNIVRQTGPGSKLLRSGLRVGKVNASREGQTASYQGAENNASGIFAAPSEENTERFIPAPFTSAKSIAALPVPATPLRGPPPPYVNRYSSSGFVSNIDRRRNGSGAPRTTTLKKAVGITTGVAQEIGQSFHYDDIFFRRHGMSLNLNVRPKLAETSSENQADGSHVHTSMCIDSTFPQPFDADKSKSLRQKCRFSVSMPPPDNTASRWVRHYRKEDAKAWSEFQAANVRYEIAQVQRRKLEKKAYAREVEEFKSDKKRRERQYRASHTTVIRAARLAKLMEDREKAV